MSTTHADNGTRRRAGSERWLLAGERRRLALLGLPTLGLALAITTVSSYLPVVAAGYTASAVVIGTMIGAEGMLALGVPLLVGAWSDRLRTRLGGRLPFMLAGTPVLAVSLVAMGVVHSIAALAATVVIFFISYFVAYEPYRALYPDLFEDEVAGRAQANQAVWRGAGTVGALASGGLLLSAATFLPFAVSAAVVVLAVAVFTTVIVRTQDLGARKRSSHDGASDVVRRLGRLVAARPGLRWYFLGNSLWELSLGALKTFIVLYVTQGLGYSLSASSLIIGAVAIIVLAGALVSGKLADRYGKLAVMRWGLWGYGLTLAVPLFTADPHTLVIAVPVIALGGGMIMSLPYAILMPLMPRSEHGLLTGFYAVSRGIGTMLGPLLAGVAIQLLGGRFEDTQGYAAMWIVCSGAILLSIPALARLRASVRSTS